MKVTKFVQSCLLIETTNRVALFDPGALSVQALDVAKLSQLDDVIITHVHEDHFSLPLLKQIVAKFPEVKITTTNEVITILAAEGITATSEPSEGVVIFDSPHESVVPLFPIPQEIGVHFVGKLSHPGDSHSFHETKAVLALPVTAPWGSMIRAINLAIELKPAHVLPIHDWHWNEDARRQSYDRLERVLGQSGITFHKLQTGQPVNIEL